MRLPYPVSRTGYSGVISTTAAPTGTGSYSGERLGVSPPCASCSSSPCELPRRADALPLAVLCWARISSKETRYMKSGRLRRVLVDPAEVAIVNEKTVVGLIPATETAGNVLNESANPFHWSPSRMNSFGFEILFALIIHILKPGRQGIAFRRTLAWHVNELRIEFRLSVKHGVLSPDRSAMSFENYQIQPFRHLPEIQKLHLLPMLLHCMVDHLDDLLRLDPAVRMEHETEAALLVNRQVDRGFPVFDGLRIVGSV